MKVYALYYDEDKLILKISSEKHWEQTISPYMFKEEDIIVWNDCIYLSTSRKLLCGKAKEIKQRWLDEAKARLDAIESIKI